MGLSNSEMREFYRNSIELHGMDVRALGWGSSDSQRKRFEQFKTLFGKEDKLDILDVGCGFGNLCEYLTVEGYKVNYTGMDFTPAMMMGVAMHGVKGKFLTMDLLDRWPFSHLRAFDYVVASGLFSHRDYDYLEEAVTKMFEACWKGVAFNCLDKRAEEHRAHKDEFYADYRLVYKICQTLTDSILVSEAYLPNDFTIYMWRKDDGDIQ